MFPGGPAYTILSLEVLWRCKISFVYKLLIFFFQINKLLFFSFYFINVHYHLPHFFPAAYSDPKNYYEFTARYHTAPCNSSENAYFEKALLQILSNLVAELSCEVTLIKSECHHVKMQRGGLQNENFFTFSGKNLPCF